MLMLFELRKFSSISILVLSLAFVTTPYAQTKTESNTKDEDCQRSESDVLVTRRNEQNPSIAAARYDSVTIERNRNWFVIPKADLVYSPQKIVDAGVVESSTQQDPAPKPASNGTNPAELITRIEVKYQYQNFAAGDIHGIAIVRGDYAFTPTVAFRMDLPILHFDSKTPGVASESGIGDIVTSMTFVKIFSKRFVGAVVPRIDFPTATNSTLGTGKFIFKPTVAGITPIAKGVAFVGVAEYRISFAGKQDRSDINEISIKPIILKSFLTGPLKGYYANPQLEFILDFENNNQTTTQVAANMGKVLSKNVVVFVVPTFHVGGTKRESFKLEVGFRYFFR